jgi:hypothetical protein
MLAPPHRLIQHCCSSRLPKQIGPEKPATIPDKRAPSGEGCKQTKKHAATAPCALHQKPKK